MDVIVVSKEGHRVIGFSIALVHGRTNTAVIWGDFYVSDPYRNKGVRESLMCELKDGLKRKGVRHATFLAKMSDYNADNKFFERRGFAVTSPLVAFEYEAPCDAA